jgi:hypothetical protein
MDKHIILVFLLDSNYEKMSPNVNLLDIFPLSQMTMKKEQDYISFQPSIIFYWVAS